MTALTGNVPVILPASQVPATALRRVRFLAYPGEGVNDSLKVRVFQMDWAPVFLKDRTVEVLGSSGIIEPATLNGQRQDNWRFSVGLAF